MIRQIISPHRRNGSVKSDVQVLNPIDCAMR
jgi:hypothetical protein